MKCECKNQNGLRIGQACPECGGEVLANTPSAKDGLLMHMGGLNSYVVADAIAEWIGRSDCSMMSAVKIQRLAAEKVARFAYRPGNKTGKTNP